MLKEFKAFVLRGNVIDLAVAFVIGAAFATLIKALVADMFTPLLSIPGRHTFENLQFTIGHSVFHYGNFLNDVIAFIVVAAALFFFVVRPAERVAARMQRRQGDAAPETKACPRCLSMIPFLATRCAFCTADLAVDGP